MMTTTWQDWVGLGLVWLRVLLRLWPIWLGFAFGLFLRWLWRRWQRR